MFDLFISVIKMRCIIYASRLQRFDHKAKKITHHFLYVFSKGSVNSYIYLFVYINNVFFRLLLLLYDIISYLMINNFVLIQG